jgi:hypothetical protein
MKSDYFKKQKEEIEKIYSEFTGEMKKIFEEQDRLTVDLASKKIRSGTDIKK